MRITVWVTEGTWPDCVDAARDLIDDADADVTLIHVSEEPRPGPRPGHGPGSLFGRGPRKRHEEELHQLSEEAAQTMLDQARQRLGGRHGPARERLPRAGGDRGRRRRRLPDRGPGRRPQPAGPEQPRQAHPVRHRPRTLPSAADLAGRRARPRVDTSAASRSLRAINPPLHRRARTASSPDAALH